MLAVSGIGPLTPAVVCGVLVGTAFADADVAVLIRDPIAVAVVGALGSPTVRADVAVLHFISVVPLIPGVRQGLGVGAGVAPSGVSPISAIRPLTHAVNGSFFRVTVRAGPFVTLAAILLPLSPSMFPCNRITATTALSVKRCIYLGPATELMICFHVNSCCCHISRHRGNIHIPTIKNIVLGIGIGSLRRSRSFRTGKVRHLALGQFFSVPIHEDNGKLRHCHCSGGRNIVQTDSLQATVRGRRVFRNSGDKGKCSFCIFSHTKCSCDQGCVSIQSGGTEERERNYPVGVVVINVHISAGQRPLFVGGQGRHHRQTFQIIGIIAENKVCRSQIALPCHPERHVKAAIGCKLSGQFQPNLGQFRLGLRLRYRNRAGGIGHGKVQGLVAAIQQTIGCKRDFASTGYPLLCPEGQKKEVSVTNRTIGGVGHHGHTGVCAIHRVDRILAFQQCRLGLQADKLKQITVVLKRKIPRSQAVKVVGRDADAHRLTTLHRGGGRIGVKVHRRYRFCLFLHRHHAGVSMDRNIGETHICRFCDHEEHGVVSFCRRWGHGKLKGKESGAAADSVFADAGIAHHARCRGICRSIAHSPGSRGGQRKSVGIIDERKTQQSQSVKAGSLYRNGAGASRICRDRTDCQLRPDTVLRQGHRAGCHQQGCGA